MNAAARHIACRLAIAACLLAPAGARGWGDKGHRVTAQVAEDHLSEPARNRVRALLGTLTLAQAATWPDFVRSEPQWSFADRWHYVTVEDDGDLAAVAERARETTLPDDVLDGVEFFADVLRGEPAETAALRELLATEGASLYAGSVEATALAFLVHLVGDLHQPLHVGRGDDRGGNRIVTHFFGEEMDLHGVWDSGLIEKQGLSYTELVAFLEAELGAEGAAWRGGTALDWARESRRLRQQVYTIWDRTDREDHLPELGYQYTHDQIGTVKRRLYQGGVRLAALLDSIFR